MNRRQARTMLDRVRNLVREHRASAAFHQSERDPAYLKLMMMEQALTQRVQEEEIIAIDANDPDMKKIQDKIKAKQTLNPDEQKKANALLTMKSENNTGGFLKESEIQQAQVVLAAQDMVDQVQSMLEDITQMQFKELPALVDSIKNQVGQEQATQFNTDSSAALAALVQNLQATKGALETALGVVTGQAEVGPVVPGAEDGADIGADLGADIGADLGADVGADIGAEEELGAAAPATSLGRARR
jgi:hypothetical protein